MDSPEGSALTVGPERAVNRPRLAGMPEAGKARERGLVAGWSEF
jgi:hypothetical protein